MLVLIWTLTQISSRSALLSTLSKEDIEKSKLCMKNKHPCIQESLDCSNQFYSTSINLLKSVKELLTIVNPDYSGDSGSFKPFPGIQSGALILKASSIYGSADYPDFARYNVQIGQGWCTSLKNADQYFQVGSSIPFIYEGLTISGRLIYNVFITSFRLNYTLDGSTWISYNSAQILNANVDVKQPVKQKLQPFIARAVRLLPVSWVSSICGYFEFYISKPIYNNVLPSGTLISAVASGFKVTVSS